MAQRKSGGKKGGLQPPAGYSPVGMRAAANGEALNGQGRGAFAARGDGATDSAGIMAAIEKMNRSHAMVLVGSQALILRESLDERGLEALNLMQFKDFALWHMNECYAVDGEMEPIGKLWVQAENRRSYEGITFAPINIDGSGAPPDRFYNTWRGFAVEPRAAPEKIKRFLAHIHDNVACGNKPLAEWIIGWFAHMVQRPTERIGTALVLLGKMGTGKSIVPEIIGTLFPQHYMMVDQPEHIIGKYNEHMRSLLLLQADEGFWAGDKQAAGRLKSLITSKRHVVEGKFKDKVFLPNFVRLMVTSNETWVVPTGFEERRFQVCHMGKAQMQNAAYFVAILNDMDNGGREALLHYLLHFDLDKVDVRKIIPTQALLQQKIAGMKDEDAFWYECLRRGAVLAGDIEWRDEVNVDALWGAYVAYAEKIGARHKLSSAMLGTRLRELAPGIVRKRGYVAVQDEHTGDVIRHDRPWVYELPGINECREEFVEAIRQEVNWDEGG